jgi:ATP/maltotriose-dependent transcriptional regulator MalT
MLLLERDTQLSMLVRWHEATASGGGCVVLVTGEAGIGKTALVREFVRRHGSGIRTLWGVCDPLSTPQPLGPLRDVSRQIGGVLLEALTQGTSRERIFTAMLDELERGSERVVLVIEDVHWADDASLDLLKYLGRRIGRTHAMLIATYRSDEIDARHPLQIALGHLPAEAVRRLPLPTLSESAIAELAQTLGRTAAGLHAATGGNPFHVTEVLAAPPDEVPASVRDAAIARIARLSAGARKVAEVAALVPGQAEDWLLREVLQATEATIDECGLSGMTRDERGSLAFRHELSRRAVQDSLPPAEARALHARILEVLSASGRRDVSISRLVHHAIGAGDIAAVLKFAPLAAERAANIGAHREALAHYRAALEHEDRLEPLVRARLLDSLGYECFLLGQIEEAIEVRMRALEIWRASGQAVQAADALRWLSRFNWFRGRGADAERFSTQAIATLEPLGTSNELAMAYSNKSQLAMLAAHDEEAIAWGRKAIAMARELHNTEIEAHALNNVGTARVREVGDQGWQELERSLEISLRCGFQEHVARAYTNLCSSAITHRDYVAGRSTWEAGIPYCIEHEIDVAEVYLRAFRARARFEQDAWAEALSEAEEVLGRPNIPVAARIPALVVAGRVRTRRGADGADEALDEARALAMETREPQRIAPMAAARAELAWLRRDTLAVTREVRSALDGAIRICNPWTVGELALWNSRSSAPVRVTAPVAAPYEAHLRGDYAAAASAWAALGCRYEEADALADSPDAAHRRRALEIFEELGARPMARRVRRQLQTEGVKGLKRGANRATRENPAHLTRRELEVLTLVADNLSNAAIARRLFLSAKTVDHHASAILAKLGISSRREAAMAARKFGIDLAARRQAPVGRSERS